LGGVDLFFADTPAPIGPDGAGPMGLNFFAIKMELFLISISATARYLKMKGFVANQKRVVIL
jgi:hypothetical protein